MTTQPITTLQDAVKALKVTDVRHIQSALLGLTGEKIARINGLGDIQVYRDSSDRCRNLRIGEIIDLANGTSGAR
jgi:hypothetical protein